MQEEWGQHLHLLNLNGPGGKPEGTSLYVFRWCCAAIGVGRSIDTHTQQHMVGIPIYVSPFPYISRIIQGITYAGGLAAIDALYESEGGDGANVQLTLFGSR